MPYTGFNTLWVAVFSVTVQVAGGKSVECRTAADNLVGWL